MLDYNEMPEKVEKTKSIYDLGLHERLWLDGPVGGKDVFRVPGGWIYSEWDSERDIPLDSIFVPFHPEFKQ